MRIPSFIASLLGIICLTGQACAQSQPMLTGQGLDMLVFGGSILSHQGFKSVDVFDSFSLKESNCKKFENSPEFPEPENSIETPVDFDDDLPVLVGQVGGLTIWVQGERADFQRDDENLYPVPKDDIYRILGDAMQRLNIRSIQVETGTLEITLDDPLMSSIPVMMPMDPLPPPIGIEPVDQNPALYRVTSQTMHKLAKTVEAAVQTVNHAWSNSQKISPYDNTLESDSDESDIIFELGGRLYSAESLNDVLARYSINKDESLELVYADDVLKLYLPEVSDEGFLKNVPFKVRQCDNGDEKEEEGGEASNSDGNNQTDNKGAQSSGEKQTSAPDTANESSEAPPAKRIKTEVSEFWRNWGLKIIQRKEALLKQLKAEHRRLHDKRNSYCMAKDQIHKRRCQGLLSQHHAKSLRDGVEETYELTGTEYARLNTNLPDAISIVEEELEKLRRKTPEEIAQEVAQEDHRTYELPEQYRTALGLDEDEKNGIYVTKEEAEKRGYYFPCQDKERYFDPPNPSETPNKSRLILPEHLQQVLVDEELSSDWLPKRREFVMRKVWSSEERCWVPEKSDLKRWIPEELAGDNVQEIPPDNFDDIESWQKYRRYVVLKKIYDSMVMVGDERNPVDPDQGNWGSPEVFCNRESRYFQADNQWVYDPWVKCDCRYCYRPSSSRDRKHRHHHK